MWTEPRGVLGLPWMGVRRPQWLQVDLGGWAAWPGAPSRAEGGGRCRAQFRAGSGTESLVTAPRQAGGLPSSSPCSWVAAGHGPRWQLVGAWFCVIWVSQRRVLVGTGLRVAVGQGGRVSCWEGRKRRVPKRQAVHSEAMGVARCGRQPTGGSGRWGKSREGGQGASRGAGDSLGGALGKEALGFLGTARLQGLKVGCTEGWEESGSAVRGPLGQKASSPWPRGGPARWPAAPVEPGSGDGVSSCRLVRRA